MRNKGQEKILCAAIWYKDWPTPVHTVINVKGLVLCGHRHPHVIGQVSTIIGKRQAEMSEYEQGFLTSQNRFVDRQEGAMIAIMAKQVSGDFNNITLYSEDLY